MKRLRNQKNIDFLLNFSLVYSIRVYDTVHIRNFIRTFHLVPDRCHCAVIWYMRDDNTYVSYVL